jgi:hypothetical protein
MMEGEVKDYVESIEFLTPEEIARPLPISIGLSGGSGTGKTYSALLLASGIADAMAGVRGAPVAFVDTENRRALHYRDQFPQMVGHYVDFSPYDRKGNLVGYPPERWIALLDAAEKAGVHAMVIDSWSHSWEGINGVLDLQASEVERLSGGSEAKAERVGQLAWAAIKPRYRRLVNRVIRSRVNTIICTRAKPVMQDFKTGKNARKTKTRRFDVPWDVAADGDLIFEMTAMAILDPDHPGCPRYQIKVADQFRTLFRPDVPLTAEIGRQMAEWSRGRGSAQEDKALMDRARAAARNGSAALEAFWKEMTKPQRAIALTISDDLRSIATDADSRTGDEEGFPFAKPTDEEKEAAMAAAAEAVRKEQEAGATDDFPGDRVRP